jgi:hypothetical protein
MLEKKEMKLEGKSIEAIEEEISRKSKMNSENGRLYPETPA